MNTILCDESSIRNLSAISHIIEVLRCRGSRRQHGVPGLDPVFMCALRVVRRSDESRIEFPRSFQSILQGDRHRSCLPLIRRPDELDF
jgi:hypothetical protein